MKECGKCSRILPKEQFGRNKTQKNGLSPWCKDCINTYRRNYYKTHKAEAKKAQKKWRERNKDYLKVYHEKNKKQIAKTRKDYYNKHKEERQEYRRQYRLINKEKLSRKNREYRQRNKEQIRAANKIYRRNNLGKYAFLSSTRRVRKLGNGAGLTKGEWEQILIDHDYKCAYCEDPYEHLDHILPVSKGGPHLKDNVQPLCSWCNSMKINKTESEFMDYLISIMEK